MDDEKLCVLTIVAGILLLLGLVGYTIYEEEFKDKPDKKKDTGVLLVQEGDDISVDYIGTFTNGNVFDTSNGTVARDPSVPKAVSFIDKTAYDDLTFKVGSGKMIKGFDSSVLGKKVGQTFTVTIPPEDGYGEASPDLIYHLNSTMTIPMVQKVPVDTFRAQFPVIDPYNDTTYFHPMYGWSCEIMDADSREVTIKHVPVYGRDYKIFPWNTTVVDISTQRNTITLHHHVEEILRDTRVPIFIFDIFDKDWADKARNIQENKEDIGIVTSSGGLITLDFNKEVAGRTLVFTITINDIRRGE